MGTNYYVRLNIPQSKIQSIKDKITIENIYNGTLEEILYEFKTIHIGKQSAGWQFLFNNNNMKYYEETKDSINSFICNVIKDGGQFVDEYGDEINIDDFWKMVESKKDEWSDASYNAFEKNKSNINFNSYSITDHFADGLRWSNYTEFS